jgi:hypothetical protein
MCVSVCMHALLLVCLAVHVYVCVYVRACARVCVCVVACAVCVRHHVCECVIVCSRTCVCGCVCVLVCLCLLECLCACILFHTHAHMHTLVNRPTGILFESACQTGGSAGTFVANLQITQCTLMDERLVVTLSNELKHSGTKLYSTKTISNVQFCLSAFWQKIVNDYLVCKCSSLAERT